MNQEQMKKQIMRRVQTIWWMRRLIVNPLAAKIAIFSVLLTVGLFLVSVGNVLANMPNMSDVSAVAMFTLNAFLRTEWVVQGLLFGIFALVLAIGRDIASSVKRKRQLVTAR